MITIRTSDKFLSEKEYVFDVLLRNRLGLQYSFDLDASLEEYQILFKDHLLSFPDSFFSACSEEYYLENDYLPNECSWSDFGIFSEKIPVFYGQATLKISNSNVKLGFDMIACVFFCLSRWEELTTNERDQYDRYRDDASYLIQQGIEAYPIVDYCELILRDFFKKCNVKLLSRSSMLDLTHDIDLIRYFGGTLRSLKTAAGDLAKRRSLRYFLWTMKQLLSSSKDPYDTLDSLLALNENNWPQTFYFIALKDKIKGADYSLEDDIWTSFVSRIKKSSADIGLHPSLSSYLNESTIQNEKERLEKYCHQSISTSRQHFLQYKWPETARLLEKSGILEDSTVHFRSSYGFKSGTSIPYVQYDPVERRGMKLREKPLIFMDWNVLLNGKSRDQNQKDLLKIAKRISEVQGRFTLLWHNSSYNHPEWQEYEGFIEMLVNQISQLFNEARASS